MDSCYTIVAPDERETPTVQDLKKLLEDPKESVKIDAMKTILNLMLQGDPMNGLLMHVIRFIMPCKNKQLKKLLVLYWEMIPKSIDGKMRPEMVLVVNALRNDLLHPNEFIRGQMLRFLCKLKENEILEPLVPSIRTCLEHKHPYVRKNAVLAVATVSKVHEMLIPDAAELVQNYLRNEPDASGKRNALLMLMNSNLPLAVDYYHQISSQIPSFEEGLQLGFIELIRRDARNAQADKAKYIQTIISLLQSPSSAVRFDAASSLMFLTVHASAIKSAASCYIELAVKESDNNVKLIVLEKLSDLAKKNDKILSSLVMDILRIVTSPDLLVRSKALALALELTTSRNIEQVIQFLKKELVKTHEQEFDKTVEYRQLLIQTIHQSAIRFPEFADSVVHVLMEFLGDASAVDVISFVREVLEKFEDLRPQICTCILDTFHDLKQSRVLRGALWILGEYCDQVQLMERAKQEIKNSLGPIPMLQETLEEEEEVKISPTKKVLADGTYATESAFVPKASVKQDKKPPLKQLLVGGDYYVATVVGSCLTKLSLKYTDSQAGQKQKNAFRAESMLMITSMIRFGKASNLIDEDSHNRLMTCIRTLSSAKIPLLNDGFLVAPRQAFHQLVSAKDKIGKKEESKTKVHEAIAFRLLRAKKELEDVADLTRVIEEEDTYVSKLDKIVQLTGFSDVVYAEAYVTVHQFDIVMDILIINQTPETLQNLVVEFSTLGDLKLVERPTPITVGPHGFTSFKANIKVSSTESGAIFSNVVYDGNGFNCVVLNEINIDIMDYIKPATCTETEFRSMWSEFEWENKINVSTKIRYWG
ncbi:adaptin N terminal region-domain-containing protein [Gorgonomyces haynaldii]|nr:adaptin N terminal region-domain-containing protein [Gorgonomyces haynaldii]